MLSIIKFGPWKRRVEKPRRWWESWFLFLLLLIFFFFSIAAKFHSFLYHLSLLFSYFCLPYLWYMYVWSCFLSFFPSSFHFLSTRPLEWFINWVEDLRKTIYYTSRIYPRFQKRDENFSFNVKDPMVEWRIQLVARVLGGCLKNGIDLAS